MRATVGFLLLVTATGCRQALRSPVAGDRQSPAAWETLLARVATEEGLVDYDALEADRGALDAYVGWLSTEEAWPGKLTRDWHAQYLNAYNALILFQVLERDRPKSVLDIRGLSQIPGFRFFHGTQFQLGDEWLTLSEIENERVRWKEMDYRDHAALNCASMSCPPIRAELYRPVDLPKQLDDQWRRWLNDDQRGVRIEEGRALFNPIFDWYERDIAFFSAGVDPCTLAAAVTNNAKKRKQLYDLASQGCPHSYFEYDWSLNDASPD
jgi:Protein of unknown function, DUF547